MIPGVNLDLAQHSSNSIALFFGISTDRKGEMIKTVLSRQDLEDELSSASLRNWPPAPLPAPPPARRPEPTAR